MLTIVVKIIHFQVLPLTLDTHIYAAKVNVLD